VAGARLGEKLPGAATRANCPPGWLPRFAGSRRARAAAIEAERASDWATEHPAVNFHQTRSLPLAARRGDHGRGLLVVKVVHPSAGAEADGGRAGLQRLGTAGPCPGGLVRGPRFGPPERLHSLVRGRISEGSWADAGSLLLGGMDAGRGVTAVVLIQAAAFFFLAPVLFLICARNLDSPVLLRCPCSWHHHGSKSIYVAARCPGIGAGYGAFDVWPSAFHGCLGASLGLIHLHPSSSLYSPFPVEFLPLHYPPLPTPSSFPFPFKGLLRGLRYPLTFPFPVRPSSLFFFVDPPGLILRLSAPQRRVFFLWLPSLIVSLFRLVP